MDNTKTRFIPVTLIAAILNCGSGCATSHNPKPETRMVIVATCKESDKTACALVYGTLREHGIVAIGVGNGGWNDVNVDASRAAEARKILSGLSTEGHSFRVIDK